MPEALRVAVVDYDAGNTLSVTRALEKVGARVDVVVARGTLSRGFDGVAG